MNNLINELNINLYNKGSSRSDLEKNNLRRNPILTPLDDYSYNKNFYFEIYNKNELNDFERLKNSLIQEVQIQYMEINIFKKNILI